MSEDELEMRKHVSEEGAEYLAPAIEEIVTRESLDREAQYAGAPVGSRLP